MGDNECTSRILNVSQLIFTCLPNVIVDELPLYNYTANQLAHITSLVVNGINNTSSGPYTSIPPNICLLSNLQVSKKTKIISLVIQSKDTLDD